MTNEPLGLPKGSVRAILVLSIVIFAGIELILKESGTFAEILKVLIPLYIGVQLPSGRGDS